MSTVTKLLIIRLSSIGDVVLTTPVVRCLKQQLDGESEIHYLIKEQFATVLDGNPNISKIHLFRDNLNDLIEELQNENFHYIIDLHKNFRSLMIRRRLKILSFDFPKYNVQKWVLVNFKIDLMPDVHLVDRYFEAVRALGVEKDEKGLDFFINEKEKVNVTENFGFEPNQYLVIAIGGAHEGKKLSKERLRELVKLIAYPTILIGGKEDVENGNFIAEELSHLKNFCGKLSIHNSASLMEQSRLVISHDSGMMHIAASFKKKIISLWGATVPKFGMYPYLPHPDSIMIAADHLKFRPTSKLGNRGTKKERKTTEEIDLNKVKVAVERLWEIDR